MNAELIAIGTELILGEITDTNSTYIARSLRDIGVNVFYITAVGDNLDRITNTLRQGLSRSDLIITTGGLGPTVDDMTRQGVAAATNRELVFHQHLLDFIAERFKGFGMTMTENNRQQAFIPADAIIIENPVGTAPCYIVESEQGIIISLPGVPREMKHLLTNNVIPYLRQKMGLPAIIKAKVLRCTGIGESTLDDQIADFMKLSNPTVGLAAHAGIIDIRITARAESEAEADQMIAGVEAPIRAKVEQFIFGTDGASLDETVLSLLERLGYTIALLEAETGSVIAERIRKLPSGAQILQFADHRDNLKVLIQDRDLPLNQLAEELVTEMRETQNVTIGIAILNQKGKTAIAVSTPDRTWARITEMGSDADLVYWAGNWALGFIWRYLQRLS